MGKVNAFENLIEKTVDSSEVFAGEMLHVYRDNIELPNGKMATREYVKHVGAVAVVALTENGSVVMEKQYRYPARRVVTEIPAGKLDSLEEDRLGQRSVNVEKRPELRLMSGWSSGSIIRRRRIAMRRYGCSWRVGYVRVSRTWMRMSF